MRIRTIKPEFYLHETLFELERETGLPIRLAFTGLWCVADREGRFKWEPRKIGIQILPYDQIDFSRVLDALWTRGFVRKYASGQSEFGVIPSFLRHQVINNRERASDLPEPLDIKDFDASATREARDEHTGKAEGKGREGNKEGNGREDLLSFLQIEETPKPKKPKANATPEMVRIGKLLNRRDSTPWKKEEIKAFYECDFVEEEIQIVEAFYLATERDGDPLHRRTGLLSLLNHSPDEVGKAQAWAKKYGRPLTNRPFNPTGK